MRCFSNFPPTRYQGSKYKILEWIKEQLQDLDYETVLDLFSGSASTSYLFKTLGKEVWCNDYLKCNQIIAKALIENSQTKLTKEDVGALLEKNPKKKYPEFIQNTFSGIYYTDKENIWLDRVVSNIQDIKDIHKQALAWFSLFQSCLIKRPYNLFHRKNLYVREAKVKRSFGNKKTWDRGFEEYFTRFAKQANEAVFDNGKINKAHCHDAFSLTDKKPDLVYIDPPYISEKGQGVDYLSFYHFLEGMVDYENWKKQIDPSSKHLRFKSRENPWHDPSKISSTFNSLFNKYQNSILVISYRDDGLPSIDTLQALLEGLGKRVSVHKYSYQYVLSKKTTNECLLIAK